MKVWVTRDEPEDGPLTAALREAGLEVVHEPVLERRKISGATEELAQLRGEDWLVLTSAYAVGTLDPPPPDASNATSGLTCRIAAVGEATKQAAEARGWRIEHVGSGTARDLFAELAPHARGHVICHPRSSQAKTPEMGPGITVVNPVTYETRPRAFDRAKVRNVEVIAVASPSAVKVVGKRKKRYASLGPTTSAALQDLGIEPWVEASEKSFESLAQAIAEKAE